MSTFIHQPLTAALLTTLATGSLGALIIGLTSPTWGQLARSQPSTQPAASPSPTLAQSRTTATEETPVELAAEVCVSLPDWQRPSEQDQAKQLGAMSRYGSALADEPLLSAAKNWWSHEAFAFTTYGLSARTDPLYLSGVWTAMDSIWDCYAGDQPERINNGDLAEVWLINHSLVGVQWQDDHYLLAVEPSATGLQIVQFQRQEQDSSLPISLVTTVGHPLAIMAGDW
ncbi:MAG: hypothetical protein ACFCVD_00850 [Nodosilinea sp.]